MVLAEPGGELDASLDPTAVPVPRRARRGLRQRPKGSPQAISDGGLMIFFEAIDGEGAWARLPAAPKQQLRDNAHTLIGQVGEKSSALCQARSGSDQDTDAADRRRRHKGRPARGIARAGSAYIPGVKTAMIPNTRHWMFEQAPQRFCEIVLEFLAGSFLYRCCCRLPRVVPAKAGSHHHHGERNRRAGSGLGRRAHRQVRPQDVRCLNSVVTASSPKTRSPASGMRPGPTPNSPRNSCVSASTMSSGSTPPRVRT